MWASQRSRYWLTVSELVGVLDLLLRYPDDETLYIGLLQVDLARQGQGIGAAACRALEDEVRARWPWVRRLRLSVVRTNDQVLGFWHRMGFTETGEVRPWRYDCEDMRVPSRVVV